MAATAGWRVGTYVGRSCTATPPLGYESRRFPDLQTLNDALALHELWLCLLAGTLNSI